MTESQRNFGKELLQEYATDMQLTEEQAVRVLMNTRAHRNFWNWINADEFLNEELKEQK